ncbi:MAG: 6-phosphofructokinase [unclassified Hahellaceae]|nr:6-phosphofructokinase [Hahellaceae bacterium]|tara:strand:+ start:77903 stop:79186 length:1284 start_codon:yes stop_codon:yes gene_type:complete
MRKNAFYAQSGGVTAVINASAAAVIEACRQHPDRIGTLYAGRNGILGALREELIDTSLESDEAIAALKHTPGGAFGSCRHKLKDIDSHIAEYERIIEVFRAHDIGYFFYNGGGDSSDTTLKMSQVAEKMGYPLVCVGIPKTVDNDLPLTDCSPGFGSVAKYIATSVMEATLDIKSMCNSSTKIFVMEVMGRHAGWIAAAAGLAQAEGSTLPDGAVGHAPQVILFPEVAFDEPAFLAKVQASVERDGFCTVVVSEGVQNADGEFLANSGLKDVFGHSQLGGVAPLIANLIKDRLGYRYHWAVADYLQRSARHIVSATDLEHAVAVGQHAVELALEGRNASMSIIVRESDMPYRWHVGEAPLSEIANVEKFMPANFISEDGFGITAEARQYLKPLIVGEAPPPFKDGLPAYVTLRNELVAKKLPDTFDI